MKPVFPRTNLYRLPLTVVVAVAVLASLSFPAFAWTVKSRELVDVELDSKGALNILVSAPGAPSPGLYQWPSGALEPTKICDIGSPSFFSFNRLIVMERVSGVHDALRLYDASTCAPLGQIDTVGRIIDADARDELAAIAVQYAGDARALELYSFRGKRVASTGIGRNVELGFAPDGKTLLNFDLSDSMNAAWRLRPLARTPSPRWMNKGEVTFIPGAQFVKQYADGALSIVQWATGSTKYVTPLSRTARVRQLSHDGRYGVIHERVALGDLVAWFDFATGTRGHLGTASIDHASISADGSKVAWTERGGPKNDEVSIRRASVSATGAVTVEN